MGSKHLAYIQCCCDKLRCNDLSCERGLLFLLVHSTGKSIRSEIHTSSTRLGISNYGGLTCKKEEAVLDFFNPNAVHDFISVVDGSGGLPVAGNRDWRGNRASLEESWPTWWDKPPKFARGTGEKSL